MVSKEFKGRFKNTILGYFWHLLNPLSQIFIYLLIFTVIFGNGIPNYWVYISCGMFAFSFFQSTTSGSSTCIIINANLVTKMAIAKEIIVISKMISNLLTLTISYCLLFILMIISGANITLNILWTPIIIILLSVFSLGVSFVLCSITVYVRDISNAANILFGCLLFALPIIYTTSVRSNDLLKIVWHADPLFYYIESIHDVFYSGVAINLSYLAICIVSSFLMLIVGLVIFKQLERGFAERL